MLETYGPLFTPVFKSIVGMRLNQTTHAQSDLPGLDKVFFATLGVEMKDWISLCVLSATDLCIDSHHKFECGLKGQRWIVQLVCMCKPYRLSLVMTMDLKSSVLHHYNTSSYLILFAM